MRLAGRVVATLLVLVPVLGATPAYAAPASNCLLTRAGEVYCDGAAQPVRIRVAGKVVQLAASGDSTCALTEPGEVYCWGADEAAARPGDDGGLDVSPLLLIAIGLALVGAGFTLVKVGGQGARSSAESRQRSAPSLTRST